MHYLPLQTVTYLAAIADPTPGGVLNRIFTFLVSALMVLAVLAGGYYVFKVFLDKKGATGTFTEIRNVVLGVLIVEAVLGGLLVIANYTTDFIPSFMS